MKVKLDKQALVDFLLRHGEKLVVALAVLAAVALMYGAVRRDRYPSTPEQLQAAAQRATAHIQATPATPDGFDVVNYGGIVESRIRNPLAPKPYALATWLDNPVFPKPQLRGEPKVLPVQALRASAGFAGFAIRENIAAPHGQRWVVLTGLVPVAQQEEAYLEAFKTNRREGDKPKYYRYYVERAEIVPGATEEPQWVDVDMPAALKAAQQRWSNTAAEVVPAKYLYPEVPERLVFPLGPRADGTWDDKVAHPPEIPVGTEASAENPETPSPDTAAPGTEDPFNKQKTTPAERAATEGADRGGAAGVTFYLFRFFDFDIKPGHQYRYRVKLALYNPNYGVEARRLESADLGKKQFIGLDNKDGDWSDPSPVITAYRDDRVRLAGVKPGIRGEGSATMILLKWLEDAGVQVSRAESNVIRGQWLNYYGVDAEGLPADAPNMPSLLTSDQPKAKSGGPKFDCEAKMMVLDMRGGEKLPGRDPKSLEPAEMLLWDRDGTLVVHSELDDAAESAPAGGTPGTAAAAAGQEGGGLMMLDDGSKKPKR